MKCANPMATLAEERRPPYPLPHASALDDERDDLGLNGLARFQITASPVQRWPRGGRSSGARPARPCVTAWPCIAPRYHPVTGWKATHVTDVARAVELALRWPGPGSIVLNVGTGRNHSVMDMLASARKTATPLVDLQAPHPADAPETIASITAAEALLGWHLAQKNLARWSGKLRIQQMKTATNFPDSIDYLRGQAIFVIETTPTDAPVHLLLRNSPALRSSPMAVSGGSRKKQIPSSKNAAMSDVSTTAPPSFINGSARHTGKTLRMKVNYQPLIPLMLAVLLVSGCSDDSDKGALKLYKEASQVLDVTKKGNGSYSDVLVSYRSVKSQIDRILSEYPSSEVALGLSSGNTLISGYTLKQFRDLEASFMNLAQAEQCPLSCALLVAKTIEGTSGRSIAMARIAGKYAEAGQQKQALQMLSQALDIAKTNTWPDFRLLCMIAGKYAEAGDFIQALETARTNEDAGCKSNALEDIACGIAKLSEKDKAILLDVTHAIKPLSQYCPPFFLLPRASPSEYSPNWVKKQFHCSSIMSALEDLAARLEEE